MSVDWRLVGGLNGILFSTAMTRNVFVALIVSTCCLSACSRKDTPKLAADDDNWAPVTQPSSVPAPVDAKLSMTCPSKTWQQAKAEAKAGWTEQNKYARPKEYKCGDLTVGYKYYPPGGAVKYGHFTLIAKYPLKGKLAAAAMKDAVDALFPNIGQPVKSVGACEPAAQAKAAMAAFGSDKLADFRALIKSQGGFRGAIFDVDGERINVMVGTGDEGDPNTMDYWFTDKGEDDPAIALYPSIPWGSTAPCGKGG
jgi:hypothetical protein